jgi:phage terminase Nu1 subunit (DNA packaging protein)
MSVSVNKSGLAELFACSLNNIDAMIRMGMPATERGGKGRQWAFNPSECFEWRLARERQTNNTADEDELRRRKLAAETGKAELEFAKAKGEVALLADVEKAVASAFAEVRASMRNLPQRAVVRLIGEQNETKVKQVLLAEIDQALQVLSDVDLLAGDDDASV